MIRKGKYKYIYYVRFRTRTFRPRSRPGRNNQSLHNDPAHQETLKELEAALRSIVDPEAADEAAFQSQCAKVEAAGGPEALVARRQVSRHTRTG